MNRLIYRFDQLFKKMPNGQYRERDKPAPPLDVFHRHDYFWSPTTGRLCVLYPARRVRPNANGVGFTADLGEGESLPTAAVMAAVYRMEESVNPFKPLLGGDWGCGARINNLGWTWGACHPDVIFSGWRDAMMQAPDLIIDGAQQQPSGGTNDGTSETTKAWCPVNRPLGRFFRFRDWPPD